MNDTNIVCMAQIEIITGNIDANAEETIATINKAKNASNPPKFIIFPELTTSGYNCGELFESHFFIDACVSGTNKIKAATKGSDIVVVVGSPRYNTQKTEKNGTLRIHNSAFVFQNGEELGVYDKILLANDAHHEDRKYFLPGSALMAFEAHGIKFSVLNCEDVWRNDHNRDLVGELKSIHKDLNTIFCINYSYFTYKKNLQRKELIQTLASEYSVNIFYVNAVGVGDIVKNFLLYDGSSFAYSRRGQPIGGYYKYQFMNQLPSFEAAIGEFPLSGGPANNISVYEPDPKSKAIWEALLYGTATIFKQLGLTKPQVHLSGGLDSSIVAVLCAKALGHKNCVFMTNPSHSNSALTIDNAGHTAKKLGVPLEVANIEALVEETARLISKNSKVKPITLATAHALARTLIGLTKANEAGSAVVCTGNQTENILGWFTFHDIGSSGTMMPLGDLTKMEEFALAEYINRHYDDELIPTNLIDGTTPPLAELPDANKDPFDYWIVSGICADLVRKRKLPQQIIDAFDNHTLDSDLYNIEYIDRVIARDAFVAAVNDSYIRSNRCVYKNAQAAPSFVLSERVRGFSDRATLLKQWMQLGK